MNPRTITLQEKKLSLINQKEIVVNIKKQEKRGTSTSKGRRWINTVRKNSDLPVLGTHFTNDPFAHLPEID